MAAGLLEPGPRGLVQVPEITSDSLADPSARFAAAENAARRACTTRPYRSCVGHVAVAP
jgi:hypothetical protein